MKSFVVFWATSSKLTVCLFLTHCYILRKFGQDRVTISYSWHKNNQMQIKVLYEKFGFFWAILKKLSDFVFLIYCYMLRKFAQHRMSISYTCFRNNKLIINILYEVLFCFLSYFNEIHRLCISYSLLHSVKIWSKSDG